MRSQAWLERKDREMEPKAYFMVKTRKGSHEGDASGGPGLSALPEVEKVEPVSGKFDFLVTARVDSPAKSSAFADRLRAKDGIQAVEVLKAEASDPNPFVDEVASTPGGEGVHWCIQCGVCSASCPNVAAMDYSPRGTGEERSEDQGIVETSGTIIRENRESGA